MYKLPKKSKGDALKAADWNNHVEAIQDALNRSTDFQTMLPSVPAANRWTGGRYAADKGGFSLRSLVKRDTTWEAFFNPGQVVEVHAGGVRVIVPKISGVKMNIAPYQPLKAEAGKKVYLDLVWGDNSHDCITEARISTEETPPGGRSARLTLGEFVSAAQSSGSSAGDITYTPFLTGCITYAAASFSEGWRVVVNTDAQGSPEKTYVKKGDIYIAGQLAQRGGGVWEEAPKEEGEIWLEVKCTGDGVIKSAELKEEKGSSKPLQCITELEDEEFTYCFLLAKVKKIAEPLQDDGNLPSLVSVKQYALGAVYCGVAQLGMKAGKGIEIVELEQERKKEIAALIEDAKAPSSADFSLIYGEEEGGGDGENPPNPPKDENKGEPYKLKLLSCDDGSISFKDEEGRLNLSAQRVEPGDGLEWKKEQDANGNAIDTQVLQVKIDSTAVDSPARGRWPVDLSVSPQGLAGELDLTVDTKVHDLGDGASVALSNATAGVLSLEVTPGESAEELSFRAPLRKNGGYVVLDYVDEPHTLPDGTTIALHDRNGQLDLEVDTANTSGVSPSGGCDCHYTLSLAVASAVMTVQLKNNDVVKSAEQVRFTSNNGSIIIG